MSRSLLLSVVVVLVIAACSEAPTADSSSSRTDDGSTNALTAIEEELKDLDPASRESRLLELARAEEGVTTLYASMLLSDSEAVVAEFHDKYGLEIEIFRANSGQVLQRILQEAQADFSGADVVLTGALELEFLSGEGLLLPLNTPASADIVDGAVFEHWAGVYIQTFVAAWNTDKVGEADIPSSWEELLTRYPDGLAMELEDWDWFATLVEDYFVAELGYSEADAVDLFRKAAGEATIVSGHTFMSELLAAGEFDLVASAYQTRIARIQAKDGPLGWEPAVEPLVFRPNGTGVHRDTETPATALLFVEFLLTHAQPTISSLGRAPANTTVTGGLPTQYDLLPLDVVGLTRDRAKWESLYASIVELSPAPVLED